MTESNHDPINHPKHYAGMTARVECIDIARHLPYNLGCAFKYVWRAGAKDPTTHQQDLQKAIWYLKDYNSKIDNGSLAFEYPGLLTALAIWKTIEAFDDLRSHALAAIVESDIAQAIRLIDSDIISLDIDRRIEAKKEGEILPCAKCGGVPIDRKDSCAYGDIWSVGCPVCRRVFSSRKGRDYLVDYWNWEQRQIKKED